MDGYQAVDRKVVPKNFSASGDRTAKLCKMAAGSSQASASSLLNKAIRLLSDQ